MLAASSGVNAVSVTNCARLNAGRQRGRVFHTVSLNTGVLYAVSTWLFGWRVYCHARAHRVRK